MSARHNQGEFQPIIKSITAAITNARLYSFDHPQVAHNLRTAYNQLSALLHQLATITFMVAGNDLIVNQQPITNGSPNTRQFVRWLKQNGIGYITFEKTLQQKDFVQFIRELSAPATLTLSSRPALGLGKVELCVKSNAGQPVGDVQVSNNEHPLTAEQTLKLANLRDTKLAEIKDLYSQMKRRRKIDVRSVDDMIKAFIRGFTKGIKPLGLLASLKSFDEYTFTHVVNVCLLTMSQAESLGFKGQHLYDIGIASVLHDVGKMFIPDEIINKPGKLTTEERTVIETHTVKGARYILSLENIPKLAVLGALEHHIRYDGSGYPRIDGDWKPNIISQMIAIADMFDAMRSRRPYQDAKPQALIVKILQEEKGVSYNPLLVDNFLSLISQ
jgi:HD-GYP domain-containing protein (c-di-GMP phosphodiesterase class II)